jgi:hypothetical protein
LTALAQIKYHSILAASAQINFFLMLKNIFKLFFFRLVWPLSYTYLSSVLSFFLVTTGSHSLVPLLVQSVSLVMQINGRDHA